MFNKYKKMILLNILGILLYTIGMICFAAPHKIAPGGATGIAVMVNYITGFPVGLFGMVFNLPLIFIIIKKKFFPKDFIVKITISIVLMSLSMDYVAPLLPVYEGNALLASMFAGAFMGSGFALVNLGESDTGGITLMGLIIQKFFPSFQVGFLITVINSVVVLGSGIVYRNIESILYAIMAVYISGLFMDKIIDNVQSKDLIIVMSECTDKVRCVFLENRQGITILKGEGGYTSETQRVIMGAASKKDCAKIQKQIKSVDPQALIIVTQASRVMGKEFGAIA